MEARELLLRYLEEEVKTKPTEELLRIVFYGFLKGDYLLWSKYFSDEELDILSECLGG